MKDILNKTAMRLYRALKGKSRERFFFEEISREISRTTELCSLFPEDKLKRHYVYANMRDTIANPDLDLTRIRLYRMYDFFKKNYPQVFDERVRVLDVGDTSGVLFEAMGRKGTSLNINKECVEYIRSKGIEALLGDAEDIKLPDKSFDYVFSFQCLEHLPNPLKALCEMGRIARKKVFISIPYTEKTVVYDKDYWIKLKKESWKEESVRDCDCHVFEFSASDLKKLLTYTNLRYESSGPVQYFNEESVKGRLLNQYYPSYFNFFVLEPA